jgi:hypothetical protein
VGTAVALLIAACLLSAGTYENTNTEGVVGGGGKPNLIFNQLAAGKNSRQNSCVPIFDMRTHGVRK